MILSAHQPAYLPWLGYFYRLARSDVFVFLDHVQYEKNSFINRNRIKTAQGPLWLTIPVLTKGHTASSLRETAIDGRQNWKQKHLRSIWMNYRKAPRFEAAYPKLEALYAADDLLLADLCWRHLQFWLSELGIRKQVVRSSGLPIEAKKSDLVLQLCRHFRADHYLSGVLGKNYLEEQRFREAGIVVEYQAYQHPVYPQLHGGCLANLSILDFWMNTDQFELVTPGGRK